MPGLSDPLPSWVIPGIALVETGSTLTDTGWHYADRRVGSAGEHGMMQMKRDAFNIAAAGQPLTVYPDLANPAVAVRMARRYLAYLRRHTASWDEAVGAYKTGLTGLREHPARAAAYVDSVKAAAATLISPTP